MSSRTIQENEADGRKIELVGRSEGETEYYVDGVHGVQVTGPIVKLNLYTLGIDSSAEFQRRESVCRLVMSTPQLLQFADFMTQFASTLRQSAQAAQTAQPANPAAAPAKK